MRQSVNYTLYWVRLTDEKGRFIFKDSNEYISDSEEHILIHVEDVKKRYEDMFRMNLTASSHYQQTPKEEFIKDVVGYTAMITGTSMEAIRNNKIKDRTVSDARKIIVGICSEMKLTPSQIHRKAGFDRSGVYSQEEKCRELYETNENFRNTYNAVKKAVLEENGISFKAN